MSEVQAQELIALMTALNGYAEQAVFVCQVIATATVLRVGQGIADRILWSKGSKKLW